MEKPKGLWSRPSVDEADAALDETAGEEAFGGVDAGLIVLGVHAIEGLGFFGFLGEVHEFGDGELHLAGKFVIRDGGFEIVVLAEAIKGLCIEGAHEIEFLALE